MNRILVPLVCIVLLGCTQNKLTGKKQLSMVSNEYILQLSSQEYTKVLQSSKIVRGTPDANMVQEVAGRITRAVTAYYQSKGFVEEVKALRWEYHLIDGKEVNAWCMPGGKIAVYTGILPVTQNRDALAIVIGHEIAHAVAEHGRQRASGQQLQQLGALAVAVGTSSQSDVTRQTFMQLYGITSIYGAILPFSRNHELEADKLGLQYAAMAGYDPRAAIPFWERMAKLGAGQKPPEFASTHPAESRRIAALQKMMPEAMTYYEAARKK